MMDNLIFDLPCYLDVGQKRVSLTMNWYRNAHHFEQNTIKSEWWPLAATPFKAKRIAIHYLLCLDNKRRTDLMNWCSIADKFFADWLVARKYIKDDTVRECSKITCEPGKAAPGRETHIIATVHILE